MLTPITIPLPILQRLENYRLAHHPNATVMVALVRCINDATAYAESPASLLSVRKTLYTEAELQQVADILHRCYTVLQDNDHLHLLNLPTHSALASDAEVEPTRTYPDRLAKIIDAARRNYAHVHIAPLNFPSASGAMYKYVYKHATGHKDRPYQVQVPIPQKLRTAYSWPRVAHAGYYSGEKTAAKIGAYIKRRFDSMCQELESAHTPVAADRPGKVGSTYAQHLLAATPDAKAIYTDPAFADVRTLSLIQQAAEMDAKELTTFDVELKREDTRQDRARPDFCKYRDVKVVHNKNSVAWSVTVRTPSALQAMFQLPTLLYIGRYSSEDDAACVGEAARRLLSAKEGALRAFLTSLGHQLRI